ncbi:MAG: hypothetical protein PHP42_03090 [Bacteroidota bacterium]|nr:hypothetical protein [Bacteroidota bacterium]
MKNFALITLLTLSIAGTLPAQDFGYEYYNVLDFRSIGANYSMQNFSARPSNSLPDSLRISFTSVLPFVEYRELGLRLAVGYQEYKITDRTKTSISVYAESSNDFSLNGKGDRSGFFIPVVVSANYVKADGGILGVKNFDVASLGLGSGMKYRYFTRTFGVIASGVAAFHYATEGFSTEYGSSVTYAGEVECVFPDIGFSGLLVGYRYHFQSWNMSNAGFDYQRYYHGPFIGILF